VNVREAIAFGREALVGQGDSPALDAEVLLRHVLRADRARLYTYPEHTLTTSDEAHYRALLTRRRTGEPVAYITGRQEFMGLLFHVDRRVLIPRSETETLVERALLKCSEQRVKGDDGGEARRELRVVDVGTGSGAIGVSLAAYGEGLWVVATDVSLEAIALAHVNARRLCGVDRRVRFVACDLLGGVQAPFDLIVANLPYIKSAEMESLPVSVRDYEPHTALNGGQDGLDAYRALLTQAPDHLKRGGTLLMECDPDQAAALRHLALDALPGASGLIVKDLARQERIVEITW
jgi:release factor glutamine methyltransferase